MQRRALKLAISPVLLGAALAACQPTGPAPTEATAGSAGRPMEQRVFQQPHSAPVSQGSPTLSGGDTSGRPGVTRSGPGSGDLGGSPETSRRGDRSRSN